MLSSNVFGDPSTWMKIFQETHMDLVYFYTKLKKKNKHIERSTHSVTWRIQKDEELCASLLLLSEFSLSAVDRRRSVNMDERRHRALCLIGRV